MKTQVNRTIEEISKKPLEKFTGSILVGSMILILLSWGTVYYFLNMSIQIKSESNHLSRPLGALLWKIRINR
ncbi:MAG: hypothetical protein ABIQ95_02110 [Bdellovibrionia bacterium]